LEGAVATEAARYHATIVALEHRYYGESQPFPTLSAENMRYLSSERAIADLAAFEAYARTELGLTGKWVTVGGSYSGSLSAYYRQKYPTLTVGALASSAPVQARANFEDYDRVVHDRVTPACAIAMQAVVAKLESTLQDPQALAAVKAEFDAQDITDSVDFLYVVADMGAMAVQYGSMDTFCSTLLGASDPVAGYAKAGVDVFKNVFNMTPLQDSFQSIVSENPEDYMAGGFGSRQWFYQSCTEFGYFQNAYHDPAHSVRSHLINPAFHADLCAKLFNTPPLNTAAELSGDYAPLLNAATDRLLMTNGSNDPWATLSISPANGNATNPNITTDTIEGGAHCDDLSTPGGQDSASLTQARGLFDSMLAQWLK
jgi:pimeloyl-ACP methyl ester carboxylesterase